MENYTNVVGPCIFYDFLLSSIWWCLRASCHLFVFTPDKSGTSKTFTVVIFYLLLSLIDATSCYGCCSRTYSNSHAAGAACCLLLHAGCKKELAYMVTVSSGPSKVAIYIEQREYVVE
jgi:hypothetical protein